MKIIIAGSRSATYQDVTAALPHSQVMNDITEVVCYTSKEEYDLCVKTMERWRDFKNMLAGAYYHDNLTLEDIEALIAILKKR